MKSAKEYRKNLSKKGIFYTDKKLADIMKAEFADDVREVYDPTCGCGNLLSVFSDKCYKYGQEIDEEAAIQAGEIVNATIRIGDTLAHDLFGEAEFEAIVANPPFSVAWEPNSQDVRFNIAPALAPRSRADWAFVLHCLFHLSDDGKCAILLFPGTMYRGNNEYKIRKWFVELGVIEKIVLFEGGYFEDTNISVILMTFHKVQRADTRILFEDHKSGRHRLVSLNEIADNDYNISVSTYVSTNEKKREDIDISQLNNSIIKANIEHIDNTYKLLQLTDKLENTANADLFIRVVKSWLKKAKNNTNQTKINL